MTAKTLLLAAALTWTATPSTSAVIDYWYGIAKAAMPRQPVRSSNIASIGYDAESSTLEVEFLSGAIYQYCGVPVSIHEGLMNASSHGGYLDDRVKGVYHYRRVH